VIGDTFLDKRPLYEDEALVPNVKRNRYCDSPPSPGYARDTARDEAIITPRLLVHRERPGVR